jgi:1-aminocyclopropane-1-carboxylate deaminase/D-cysteine desulfhydrase-like pyridoxal-dependent ACC family enzyme
VIDAPNFADALPRFRLTELPMPIDRALGLEELLRSEGLRPPRIFIKRDDLLRLALGGNKIRNLEFSIGAALAAGATDVVTVGRAQSNHCRLTAAACSKAGLQAHLVMTGTRPGTTAGNLLLSELMGAHIVFTGSDDRAEREAVARHAIAEIERAGRMAHYVPVGGSDPAGAVGHALAAAELVAQMHAAEETLDAIVLATATGGTQAGMLAGLRAIGVDVPLYGFAVNKPAAETAADVRSLAQEVARLIGCDTIDEKTVLVDDSQLGSGYGMETAAGTQATRLLARTEGLVLDRVYTAKAFAGLLAMLRASHSEPGRGVVFIHTGGAPVLFT